MAVRTIDLTSEAPKTHQDRDKKDRIERLRGRLRGHVETNDLKNAMLGILDLLADEL